MVSVKARKRRLLTSGVSKVHKKQKKKELVALPDEDLESDEANKVFDIEDIQMENVSEHKAQLAAIAERDPEFYKFLQAEDADLLEFDESDVSEGEEESGHTDDFAFEDDEEDAVMQESSTVRHDKDGRRIVDSALVEDLENSFFSNDLPQPSKIRLVIGAFQACVARVGAKIDRPNMVVNDENLFERIIRLCFQHMGNALYMLLDPEELGSGQSGVKQEIEVNDTSRSSTRAEKRLSASSRSNYVRFRKWMKYRLLAKRYLQALFLFLKEIQTPKVVVATLRACGENLRIFVHFKKLSSSLVKSLIRIWSRGTEECRSVAFNVLYKLLQLRRKFYTQILKHCYIAYVSNVRVVTPETRPLISIMQTTFAELCALNTRIAYHYAFVYIRQTAIHLRNSMIAKRKNLRQIVYNWQFIMCLSLWARVISKIYSMKNADDGAAGIAELAYPLTQITLATTKLFPSLKYFPLRLQCVRILITLQLSCKIFIPTLAIAVELCEEAALLIKKPPTKGKGASKPPNFECLLKASSNQIEDAGFRQSALEALFKLQLRSAYILRNYCSFPEVVVEIPHKIRMFAGQCKNPDHARLFHSLGAKIREHADYVSKLVAASEVDLLDPYSLDDLHTRIRSNDSPLSQFYNSWQKIWKMQMRVTTRLVAPASHMQKSMKLVKGTKSILSGDASIDMSAANKVKVEANDEAVEKKPLLKKKNRNKKGKVLSLFGQEIEAKDELRDLVLSDSD